MLHNVGNIKNFAWKVKRGDYGSAPDLVVFGHTHQPFFQLIGGIYFANPGSAGLPRKGLPPTVMTLTLKDGKILDHEIIKLRISRE